MAADNGNENAQLCIGDEFAKEFLESKTDKILKFLSVFRYYSMLSDKGNIDAQYGLSKLYDPIPLHHSGNFYTSGFGYDFWDACEQIALS